MSLVSWVSDFLDHTGNQSSGNVGTDGPGALDGPPEFGGLRRARRPPRAAARATGPRPGPERRCTRARGRLSGGR